jgi:hypothetical protein
MTKRNLLIVLLMAAVAAIVIFLLKPCALQKPAQPGLGGAQSDTRQEPQKTKATQHSAPATSPMTAETPPPVATPAEIDNAPPVNLTGSEVIPDIARCVSTRFPQEAKPHVRLATVQVRVVVDKFGNVRSVKTTSVEFAEEPPEDLVPMLRKLFIQAGNRAFGAKKCPPHVVNGQNVGYAIEVPLQYKH